MRNALKVLAVLLLLLLTMGNRGCDVDFGNTADIEAKTNAALFPYFPNVRTHVFQDTQQIIALSCTSGLGRQFAIEFARSLAANDAIQQLHKLRTYGALTRSHTYKYFMVGFENDMVAYDVDAQTVTDVPVTDPRWGQGYRGECFGNTTTDE